MRELKSIEERILDRALYLIGSRGTMNVPIRAIAKEANVNVSAINYYFGTKEEMLKHTKEFFIENTTRIYSILDNQEIAVEERLILFANEIMEHTIRYSGLSVMFKEAEKLKDEDEVSRKIVEETKELHHKMELALSAILDKDSTKIKFNLLIFISAILYPAEKMEKRDYMEEILNKKEIRIEYIKHILSTLK